MSLPLGLYELGGVGALVESACNQHNAWAAEQRLVRQRLQSNPAEAVAAYLTARNFNPESRVSEAIKVLEAPVEHRDALSTMKKEWSAYKRGLRTHPDVWLKYFRSDIPGEGGQYVSGVHAETAFNQNVTFWNLTQNALWQLGQLNVSEKPNFLSRVGMALRFRRTDAVVAEVVAQGAAVVEDAEPNLAVTFTGLLQVMKTSYADRMAQYSGDVTNVRAVDQVLNLESMTASFQADAFAALAKPCASGLMLDDQRRDVKASVDSWLGLCAQGKFKESIEKAEREVDLEKQIVACMNLPGYAEEHKRAQRLLFRADYHRDASTLYSRICLDVATRTKRAADLVTRSPSFKALLLDFHGETTSQHSVFSPDRVGVVSDKDRELYNKVVQDHYSRVCQLDAIRTVRGFLNIFQDRVRSHSEPDTPMDVRIQQFAMSLVHSSVNTACGADWVRDTEATVASLGLSNEVANASNQTYEELLAEFDEAVQQILRPAWADFSRVARPLPSLPALPHAPFLTQSEPLLSVLRPIASRLVKQGPPSDLDPAASVRMRLSLEAIASKHDQGMKKMGDLCIDVCTVAQALLLHYQQ